MIRAIPTVYRGYQMRSRLEARWAVFFDALGIMWEYEVQGFVLSNKAWYLPDFYLPKFNGGLFAEVKPHGGDFGKSIRLARDLRTQIWLCEGPPDYTSYTLVHGDEEPIDGQMPMSYCLPMYDHGEYENRMWLLGSFCADESIVNTTSVGEGGVGEYDIANTRLGRAIVASRGWQ